MLLHVLHERIFKLIKPQSLKPQPVRIQATRYRQMFFIGVIGFCVAINMFLQFVVLQHVIIMKVIIVMARLVVVVFSQ
ncbi:hypothetical protein BJ741DRAFT_593194 [Chytriomyces cf. hyalinus JEL632]|nr:hypothetical protein BJ741DRAFT_593194 [Chytriomyces cf. hyalinus JEL632]